MRSLFVAALLVSTPLFAGCLGEAVDAPAGVLEALDPVPSFVPRVVVGVPDSGINPYHEIYYRPNLSAHPCTYVEGFPCSVQELPLSVGGDDYDAALEADADVWASVEPDTWYWIPRTVFVAVSCSPPGAALVSTGGASANVCVLDDNGMHGTGTTSSIVMENPDALIAFREGGSTHEPFVEAGIPVDLFSVSWGYIVPLPVPSATGFSVGSTWPLYVLAAGNDPRSTLLDGWAGHPHNIVVGGAYSASQSEEAMAAKQPDVVSYYCRPTAQTKATSEMRESYCGTSFAAPTVAGALSKVVLGLRRESGYTGSTVGGFVDPVLGVTVADLRAAMNRTASYAPEAQYPNAGSRAVPLNPAAPWLQWGWGFFDGLVADATLAHLLGVEEAPEKPEGASTYMEAVHSMKLALYG